MATLATVQDYITRSRAMLQDKVVIYRYTDDDMVEALNEGILEARRLRPDLFQKYFGLTLPSFDLAHLNATVDIDPMYRTALMYYICGQMQLRDEENTQDGRATIFLNKFVAQLTELKS